MAWRLLAAPLAAQEPADDPPRRAPTHRALNLTIGGYGISVGNSAAVNGVRLNFRDAGLRRVNGINATLWRPVEPLSGSINGLAVGIAGPGADQINGVAVGLGAVVTEDRLRWVSLAGLATVTLGGLDGVSVSGLATVAQGRTSGVHVAGLAVVTQSRFRGIAAAGLATVAQGDIAGFAFGGLATGSR
jgi:hypothetical protein